MKRLKRILSRSRQKRRVGIWSCVNLFSILLALILLLTGLIIYYPIIEKGLALEDSSLRKYLPIVAMAYGSLMLLVVAIVEGRMFMSRSGALVLRNQTLDELIDCLTQLHEDERKETSSRLHDTVGSLAVALKLEIESVCGYSEAKGTHRHVYEILDELIAEVRGIASLMYPRMLGTLGLKDTLEDLVGGLENQGMNIEIDIGELPENLTRSQELCVFRVVQEAILNAIRHSNARRIYLAIDCSGDTLMGSVEDDGEGWGNAGEGMGLTLMRERLHKAGGDLYRDESPRGGARIKFELLRDEGGENLLGIIPRPDEC